MAEQPINMTMRAGPWTHLGYTGIDRLLEMAACSISLGTIPLSVRLLSTVDGLEPDEKWENTREGYDTYPMRHQLGVLSNYSSLEYRGLQHRAEWKIVRKNKTKVQDDWIWTKVLISTITGSNPNSTEYTVILDFNGVHPVDQLHTELFQDILTTTNSPALAAQALFPRLCVIIYEENS
ncbi:hypothetical protein GGR53DRAFT_525994 [Hypoxylon sp. FL1150]|nr:hypothetical protein GGR53DRAFT_525994 [Hypoxylon sp. FL1150]